MVGGTGEGESGQFGGEGLTQNMGSHICYVVQGSLLNGLIYSLAFNSDFRIFYNIINQNKKCI